MSMVVCVSRVRVVIASETEGERGGVLAGELWRVRGVL